MQGWEVLDMITWEQVALTREVLVVRLLPGMQHEGIPALLMQSIDLQRTSAPPK